MSLSAWKQKLANLPVLGKLVVGLRGVYSLGTWRAELRQQQSELNARLDAQEARLNGLGQELAELRSDYLSTKERVQRLSAETETLQQQAAEAQAREESARSANSANSARSARLASTMSWLVQRTDRLEDDLARARSTLGETRVRDALAAQPALPALGQADASTASGDDARPDAPVFALEPQSLASLLAGSPMLERWQHLFTALPDPAQAQALCLDHVPVTAWLAALRGLSSQEVALVVATHGGPASTVALPELLRAANAALAPGGLLVLVLPNAGNLLVAARLLQEDRPVGITPGRAAELARDAGLVDVRTLLSDGSELPAAKSQDAEQHSLSQLLETPARFCLFARKVV